MAIVKWTDGRVFMRSELVDDREEIEEPTDEEAEWLAEAIEDAKRLEPFALIVLSGMRGIYGDDMWVGFEMHLDRDFSCLWVSDSGNSISLFHLKRHHRTGVDEWTDTEYRLYSTEVLGAP